MKRILFLLLCSIALSCTDNSKVPSEIIKPTEMSDIMWDVLRAQSLAAEISRKDSSRNVANETKKLTQKIFEIHKITSAEFDKTYNWYTQHPDIFRLVFDSLYNQKQRQNELHKREGYKSLRKDTLRSKIHRDE